MDSCLSVETSPRKRNQHGFDLDQRFGYQKMTQTQLHIFSERYCDQDRD